MRRLALLVLLVLAPGASAQPPPPDERVAAQAFAEAALRFSAARGGGTGGDPVDAVLDRPACRREIRRLPERRWRGAADIVFAFAYRWAAEQGEASFSRFRSELAYVQTADPALISGRAAWRRTGRALASLLPRGDLCAELRAWRRAGYSRAVVRAARRQRAVTEGAYSPGMQRKIAAAADRMRELGADPRGAEAFEGDA